MSEWTFFTNHAHVLLCLARDPTIRIRDLADVVGITERAAQRIIADLAGQGYVEVVRQGRRNHYRVNADRPLRHPVEQPHLVGEVLQVLEATPARAPRSTRRRAPRRPAASPEAAPPDSAVAPDQASPPEAAVASASPDDTT